MHRSYLFAPGHNAKLLRRVFEADADAVILDLEDAVPPGAKQQARVMVAGALADRVDRRRLVVAVEMLRALVLSALGLVVLAGHTALPTLYLAAFTIGALETAFSAATRAEKA